jgi:hypothetical protein
MGIALRLDAPPMLLALADECDRLGDGMSAPCPSLPIATVRPHSETSRLGPDSIGPNPADRGGDEADAWKKFLASLS